MTDAPLRCACCAGLESHPDHAIAVAQMSGYGGVVSFEIDGDLWRWVLGAAVGS